LSYIYVVINKAHQTQNFIGSKIVLPTKVAALFSQIQERSVLLT